MGGAGNIKEDLGYHAHRRAADQRGSLARKLVGLGYECWNLFALADQNFAERPEPAAAEAHIDVAVEGLHTQEDDRLAGPPEGVKRARGADGMPQQGTDQRPEPG